MIFVIDDNVIGRKLIRGWLEKAGFHSHAIVEVENPTLAFRLLVTNYTQIQVVLTDVYFGEHPNLVLKTGEDLIQMIRTYEKDMSTEKPVFILAFSGDSSVSSKMMAAGADLFLPKPLKRTQVVDIVKSHYES